MNRRGFLRLLLTTAAGAALPPILPAREGVLPLPDPQRVAPIEALLAAPGDYFLRLVTGAGRFLDFPIPEDAIVLQDGFAHFPGFRWQADEPTWIARIEARRIGPDGSDELVVGALGCDMAFDPCVCLQPTETLEISVLTTGRASD